MEKINEMLVKCKMCGRSFKIKNTCGEFNVIDAFYCHRCFCEHKCEFYEECFTDNEQKMEMLLDILRPKLENAGFRFDGYEFRDERELGDCYACFYLTNEEATYKCEISTIFFQKEASR